MNNWMNDIDLEYIEPYPIQFANSDRLRNNEAVYIFDEVGSGKTISSGIMALDYLFNHKSGNVLVITTNALAKGGQLKGDWFGKLPFKKLGLHDKVKIVNNHYSNFNTRSCYGLVIIDEAHLFLNKETRRYKQLTKNIRADKVVFLTATPIKQTHEDLYTYVGIAESITGKSLPKDWIQEISTRNKKKKDIICSKFDVTYPVTRYFKDTIMALNVDEFKKTQARRLLPHLWKYSRQKSKLEVLLENLQVLSQDDVNKFIIFTRFVEREAYKIQQYLLGKGFIPFTDRTAVGEKSVAVVTGENAEELVRYKVTDKNKLPTVLILTYQIAEQGVNLPGFNHVINYHISSFPSALEQRFGRIDRMGKQGSVFPEIHMCFLIVEDSYYLDINTLNFYIAVRIYMNNLITYLPSKNMIISEEILDRYGQMEEIVNDHISKIKTLIQQDNVIGSLKEYLPKQHEPIDDFAEKQELIEIFHFMEEHGIEAKQDVSVDEAIEELKKEITEELGEIAKLIQLKNNESIEQYKYIVEKIGDKIFYMQRENCGDITNGTLQTIDAIDECGEIISVNESYKDYQEDFRKSIQIPLLVKKYRDELSQYFEKLFIQNDIGFVFPLGGYRDIFTEMFKQPEFDHISKDRKALLTEYSDAVVHHLPFFHMCDEFGEILQRFILTENGLLRERFDFNPFISAVATLGKRINWAADRKGLSEGFVSAYWNKNDGRLHEEQYKRLFKIEYSNTEAASRRIAKATNWYRLAYHYTGVMAEYIVRYEGLYTYMRYVSPYNILKVNLQKIHYLYEKCGCDDAEFDNKLSLKKTDTVSVQMPSSYRTYFFHYIFTNTGNYRTHMKAWNSMLSCNKEAQVYSKDIWTKGIYYELSGVTFEGSTWGNILKLPKKYEELPIFGAQISEIENVEEILDED